MPHVPAKKPTTGGHPTKHKATPMKGQMPPKTQTPMKGQMPPKTQAPMKGQMPPKTQAPMKGQMPPKTQPAASQKRKTQAMPKQVAQQVIITTRQQKKKPSWLEALFDGFMTKKPTKHQQQLMHM